MISRILVSGSTGLIGSALVLSLQTRGCKVMRLVRGSAKSDDEIAWNFAKPISSDVVSGFNAVVHLAGESIAGRWTQTKKVKIRESRVAGTTNLSQALAGAKEKPHVFVSSSAIGIYGDRGDEVLNEQSAPGSGFLPDVCREWEAATQAAANAGIRTVQMRTGVVLSARGGALGAMLTPFKMGLGGRIGDGRQWMSWIDLQDMVGAIHHIFDTDRLQGPVNMVAPNPVTNEEFTKTLGRVLSRPAILPVPAFAVKTIFGEMGETVLLGSERVEPRQLAASRYPFQFSSLRASLEKILGR
jgi:hypothetical protein